MANPAHNLPILRASLDGELYDDHAMRVLYATDASVYREIPLAVAMPKHKSDIQQLISFARTEGLSLIPRAAGTSLAGQCVGSGIVVDCSKYMTEILEVNPEEGWVRVQPGVVRDELNQALRPLGLFFGPNTSTSNRAMIGGMVGNNSAGSYSIVYGSTRDHVQEITCVLSDGMEVRFGDLTPEAFEAKCRLQSLEGKLHRHIKAMLSDPQAQSAIRSQFPKRSIHRRNSGYALDILLESNVFSSGGPAFNFSKLMAGSEGTLAFITEIKIHCDPLPPEHVGLLCVHFQSLQEALEAVMTTMPFNPRAVELMDRIIMDCTKENPLYQKNRFFLKGDPAAVLIIEVGGVDEVAVREGLNKIQTALQEKNQGFHYPLVFGSDIQKVWALRQAGLGLLSNVPGAAKPVAVVEDTAVALEDLPAYIADFDQLMKDFNQRSVYYAHAGAGELHLRPILNLKKTADRAYFRAIGQASAELVKSYEGSLSGEHGDGRVRAEFLPIMVGPENYQRFVDLKKSWDPRNLFNPGKIVEAPPMDTALRYEADQSVPEPETILDFSEAGGLLSMAEKCNGSADCRKSHHFGGTMCPSYMATRNEKDTTRARANILREMLTRSNQKNRFAHKEIYEVMDLCLSCKGCASECPSNVNVAALKAEFLHQYYKSFGIPLRTRIIGNIASLNRLGMVWPSLANRLMQLSVAKKWLGIAPRRKLPILNKRSLRSWYKSQKLDPAPSGRRVYFFGDEFSNFNDVSIGQKGIELLHRLGYQVVWPKHADSGRAQISKGLLKSARARAIRNVQIFAPLVNENSPLVGIEPSALLGFKDEYPRLVPSAMRADAEKIARHCLSIETFLAREMESGNIGEGAFHDQPQKILLHGHCHQKALDSTAPTISILSLPKNYQVEQIPSGCCGMAGSFGYEAEHYDLSMQIGELILFPRVRNARSSTLIAAPGTSCRHQIMDGCNREALHPIAILWNALLKK